MYQGNVASSNALDVQTPTLFLGDSCLRYLGVFDTVSRGQRMCKEPLSSSLSRYDSIS